MTTLEEAWGSNFNDDMRKYKKLSNKYRNKKTQESMLKEHNQTIEKLSPKPTYENVLSIDKYDLINNSVPDIEKEKLSIEIYDESLINHLKKYSKEYQTSYVSQIIKKYLTRETRQYRQSKDDGIELYTNYNCEYENDNDEILIVILVFLLLILLGEKLLR